MVISFTDWNPNELYHFGVRGMKWGQRRFQNEDGSLTSLGKERYGKEHGKRSARGMTHDLNKLDRERATAQYRYDKLQKKASKRGEDSRAAKKAKQYGDLLEKNKKMTNTILAKAKASGMKVNTKEVNRVVNKGRTVGKNLIKLGVLAGGLYAGSKLAPNSGIAKSIQKVAGERYEYSGHIDGWTGRVHSGGVTYVPKGRTAVGRHINQHILNNAGGIAKGLVGAAAVGTAVTGIKKTKGTRYKVRKGG